MGCDPWRLLPPLGQGLGAASGRRGKGSGVLQDTALSQPPRASQLTRRPEAGRGKADPPLTALSAVTTGRPTVGGAGSPTAARQRSRANGRAPVGACQQLRTCPPPLQWQLHLQVRLSRPSGHRPVLPPRLLPGRLLHPPVVVIPPGS